MKPHRTGAVITLLENGVSQHEISRKTGVDRKTVRKIARSLQETSKSPTPAITGGFKVTIGGSYAETIEFHNSIYNAINSITASKESVCPSNK